MFRQDGRSPDDLRPVEIVHDFLAHAEGSVLIKQGNTWVLCAVSVEDDVPPFLKDSGQGWVTAEYSMLPRSTHVRTARESRRGKVKGRTHEIQRLIGRSLRAVTDLNLLGPRTFIVDCDVIQADGGTRCASITGAFLALRDAVRKLLAQGRIGQNPIKDSLGAVSVGLVGGLALLDLDYQEDSCAEVDANFVLTGSGKIVEIQVTGEAGPFDWERFESLARMARKGVSEIIRISS